MAGGWTTYCKDIGSTWPLLISKLPPGRFADVRTIPLVDEGSVVRDLCVTIVEVCYFISKRSFVEATVFSPLNVWCKAGGISEVAGLLGCFSVFISDCCSLIGCDKFSSGLDLLSADWLGAYGLVLGPLWLEVPLAVSRPDFGAPVVEEFWLLPTDALVLNEKDA